MSTFPLISHRLYVAAVRSDVPPEVGRGCPHPAGDEAQQHTKESRVPDIERRDGDILALPSELERRDGDTVAIPVKVSADWKLRARGDEAVDMNPAPEAPEVPFEILESRRPMPSGVRRSQSTMRATL